MEELQTIPKVVVKELAVRYKRPPIDTMVKITDSEGAYALFKGVIDEGLIDLKEVFWVALLNHGNYVLGVSCIGVGTVGGTTVNVKEIFQLALNCNATGIILCHNHPSGSLAPSQADTALTKRIKEGCAILDLKLLDHIILTSEGYVSFTDQGWM